MNTSADAPYLDCAYKLQEYDGEPRRKRSEGKATWPGRKQVYRRYDSDGRWHGDVVTLASHPVPGVPLLVPVVRAGHLVAPLPELSVIRQRVRERSRVCRNHCGCWTVRRPRRPRSRRHCEQLAAEIDAHT